MELMDFAPLLGIPAVTKILDAYRQLVTDQDIKKFLFTVGAWVVGIGVVVLISQSSAGAQFDGNWADIVLVGIGMGATGSVVHDALTKGEDDEAESKAEFDPAEFTDIPGTDAPDA